MSRTIEAFEHDTLHVSSAERGLTPADFDALIRFNDLHGRRYFEVGHRRIKLKSFVGYLEVGRLALEILPKADRGSKAPLSSWRRGLVEMLSVALGLRLEQPGCASQELGRFRLLELIALGFLSELEPLLHHGLTKGYLEVESNRPIFRGRLRVAQHVRANACRGDRFFVEHQVYDHDIGINRLLAAALEVLAQSALPSHLAIRVAACLAQFPEVRIADVAGAAAALARIRLTRATQRYSAGLLYARMLLALQGPQLSRGRERVFALLFDMNQLWERYVAALFRRAAPASLAVSTQVRLPFWLPVGRPIRQMRPDIVVRDRAQGDGGAARLVIDTKWKVPRNGGPSDDDLRQMFVYNELLDGTRAILLYPKTEGSSALAGRYADRTHRCEQWHLGLIDPAHRWSTPAIQAQIAELLRSLESTALAG